MIKSKKIWIFIIALFFGCQKERKILLPQPFSFEKEEIEVKFYTHKFKEALEFTWNIKSKKEAKIQLEIIDSKTQKSLPIFHGGKDSNFKNFEKIDLTPGDEVSIHYGFVEKYAPIIFGEKAINLIWRIKENGKIIAEGDFLRWEGDKKNILKEKKHFYILEEDEYILGEPCTYCITPQCGCQERIYKPNGICYLLSWVCICNPPLICHRSCAYDCWYY